MGMLRRHKDFASKVKEQPHELYYRCQKNVQFAKVLDKLVKHSELKKFDYRVNHLIRRIIYDKICGGRWEKLVKPAFVDNCSIEELEDAIKLAHILLIDDTLFRQLIEESKGYRVQND